MPFFDLFGNAFALRGPRLKNYALSWLHRFGLRRFEEATRELPDGVVLHYRRGTHDEVIAREVWEEGIYPLDEVDLTSGATVIDIGAQIGTFSLLAAARGARVLAFEPCALNLDLLRRNVAANACGARILVSPKAVYRPGVQRHTLYQTYTNLGGHSLLGWVGPAQDVDCLSLGDIFDEFGVATCRVLKLDVEGAECPVLYSTPPEILARIELIYAEVIDHPELELLRQPGEHAYDHGGLMEFLSAHDFEVAYDALNRIVSGRRV